MADISRLKIFLPDGKLKPITDLATVTVRAGDAEIQRENLQSMGVVTGRLEGKDLGSVMKDIQEAVGFKDRPAAGSILIVYGGAWPDQQQSFKELLTILIAASLLVFGVILFSTGNFRWRC